MRCENERCPWDATLFFEGSCSLSAEGLNVASDIMAIDFSSYQLEGVDTSVIALDPLVTFVLWLVFPLRLKSKRDNRPV